MNTLDDLAGLLFNQIGQVSKEGATKEDIEKAKTVIGVSDKIIAIRKLQLEAVKVKREMGLQSPELRNLLLPESKG